MTPTTFDASTPIRPNGSGGDAPAKHLQKEINKKQPSQMKKAVLNIVKILLPGRPSCNKQRISTAVDMWDGQKFPPALHRPPVCIVLFTDTTAGRQELLCDFPESKKLKTDKKGRNL